MKKVLALLLFAFSQQSCVLVGGYSSEGGWYIWPGSLISLVVVIAVVILLVRRRR